MECLLCKKKIGLLRSLADRKFCCEDHRRRFPARSAKAAREKAWTDESWSESVAYGGDRHTRAAQSQSQASPALLGFFGLLFIVLAFVGVPSSSSSPRISPSTPTLGVGEVLGSAIRSRAAIRFTDDFKSGLTNWVQAGGANDWSFSGGFVQPRSLRLWKKSMPLADYNFEFQSQIEQKGIGWVYRAKDTHNYYATKILISRPGPLPGADIVRYAILNGKESNRVRLPLPIQIRPDTAYKVQVAVKGERFSTTVNGHMVDSWSDRRLKLGGVGFFAVRGEIATVRYASISDRNTFVGRLFSYFQTAIFMPAYLPEAAYQGFAPPSL